MYNRICKNLKRHYKTTEDLLNRIDQINKHFNKECRIIDMMTRLLRLIYSIPKKVLKT